jgi:hypothetical protein
MMAIAQSQDGNYRTEITGRKLQDENRRLEITEWQLQNGNYRTQAEVIKQPTRALRYSQSAI